MSFEHVLAEKPTELTHVSSVGQGFQGCFSQELSPPSHLVEILQGDDPKASLWAGSKGLQVIWWLLQLVVVVFVAIVIMTCGYMWVFILMIVPLFVLLCSCCVLVNLMKCGMINKM